MKSFFVGFFLTAFRHIGSLVLSVILLVVGLIWSDVCLYIGLFLLASNIIVALVGGIRMYRTTAFRSDDDPEFNEMMEQLSADPKGFLSQIMAAQEENRQRHGEELLVLSDDDLFETVYFQNLAIAEDDDEDDEAWQQLTGARRTVFMLGLFDGEVQNGGLCQFFVNSSRTVAPYISEALGAVEAEEHRTLFDGFVAANGIDLTDLDSFRVHSHRGYIRQTKRFDFDAFDEAYYELPPLQEKVVAFIKAHITEF